MKITPQLLEPYLFRGKKHEAYHKTCHFYMELKKHANGEYPGNEIDERRPGENTDIKTYRKKIYVALTKGEGVGLVINAFGKIRRSPDWSVKFEKEPPSKIKEGETPEDYINNKFPKHTSITNWLFSILLKEYLIDANGVTLVAPIMNTETPSDYIKPVCRVFNSDNIYEITEDWALLKSEEKSYFNEFTKVWEGNVFYAVSNEEIKRYSEDRNHLYQETLSIPNILGYLPLVPMKGIYFDSIGERDIWESRIQGMIGRLTEFVREYSDQQAEIVQHIHSEKYSFVQQECKTCEGTGKVKKNNKSIICTNCKGSGRIVSSPYNSTYAVRPAKPALEQPIPMPPIGYIEKSTEIAKLQDERTEKHLYKALCTVNLQHLFQIPLNTSGYKKELDIDESITTVHNVAEDLVRIADDICRIMIDWRYIELIPNTDERKELRPFIPVPEKFDIISTNYLMEEVQKAKTSGLNPAIVNALEREIAVKKFYTDNQTKDIVLAILELDPLPGYSIEQKMSLKADMIISDLDYTISTYIQTFVRRAVREDEKFLTLDYEAKRKKLEEYAKEIMDEQKEKMIQAEPQENGIPAKAG